MAGGASNDTDEAITGIPGPDGRMPAGDSLMSVAGRELKARGFDVWLDVDTSQLIYQAVAELVVTNPGGLGTPDRDSFRRQPSVRAGDSPSRRRNRNFNPRHIVRHPCAGIVRATDSNCRPAAKDDER